MTGLEKLVEFAKKNGGSVVANGNSVSIVFPKDKEITAHIEETQREVPYPNIPATEIHREFDEMTAGLEKKGYEPSTLQYINSIEELNDYITSINGTNLHVSVEDSEGNTLTMDETFESLGIDMMERFNKKLETVLAGVYKEEDEDGEVVYYPTIVEEVASLVILREEAFVFEDAEDVIAVAFPSKWVAEFKELVRAELADKERYPSITAKDRKRFVERIATVLDGTATADELREFFQETTKHLDPESSALLLQNLASSIKMFQQAVVTVSLLTVPEPEFAELLLQNEKEQAEADYDTFEDFLKSQLMFACKLVARLYMQFVRMIDYDSFETIKGELDAPENPFGANIVKLAIDQLEEIVENAPVYKPLWGEVKAELNKQVDKATMQKVLESDPEYQAKFLEKHEESFNFIGDAIDNSRCDLELLRVPPVGTLFDNLDVDFSELARESIDELLASVDEFEQQLPVYSESELDELVAGAKKLRYAVASMGLPRNLAVTYVSLDSSLNALLAWCEMLVELVDKRLDQLDGADIATSSAQGELIEFYLSEVKEYAERLAMMQKSMKLFSAVSPLEMLNGLLGDTKGTHLYKTQRVAIAHVTVQMFTAVQYLLDALGKPSLNEPTKDEVYAKLGADPSILSPREYEELVSTIEENEKKNKENAHQLGQELGERLRDQVIAKEYVEGVSNNEIRANHSIQSEGALYSILRSQGIPLRNEKSSRVAKRVAHVEGDQQVLSDLIDDYEAGVMTLKEIYEKYDLYKNGLYYLLDRYNITRRTAK